MSGDRPLENLAHQHQHHQQFPQQTDPRVHFTSPQSHEDPLRFGDGGDGGDGGGGGGVRSRPTLKRSQSPVNSDALILLPEVARAGKPVGSRRPFQRRRRSRACDACRARKTKCDTPDEGPCSACAAASLVCTFSEGGEDRRRAGPARRIRMLEAQVQDLTKKLQDAEAVLGVSGSTLTRKALQRPAEKRSPSSSPQLSSSSVAGSTIGSALHLDPSAEQAHCEWWRQSIDVGVPASADRFRAGMPFGPQGRNPNPHGGELVIPRSSHGVLDSNPQFIASYKTYLRNLGYPSSNTDHPSCHHGSQPAPRVPLLSEYPSIASKTLPLDLRVLMPQKTIADQLCEVFRRTIQNYTPLFVWTLFLEEKYDRAFTEPMWEEDSAVVKSIFCIVQMMLAVASQMAEDTEELTEVPGRGNTRERTGWTFFHLARKYVDLNSPTYTPDDAMFLLLMSMYLDNASLPSPCWMITGSMARVCQDVVLDRVPQPNLYSEKQLEARRRLFWAAYIQERKACLRKSRGMVLRDSDIEIPFPRALEDEDLIVPRPVEPIDKETFCSSQKLEHSLQVMIAQIHVSMLCSSLLNLTLHDNGGVRDQRRVQDLDQKFKKAWERFPPHLTDLENVAPLEIGAIRPLFFLQYCRLLLYRYFTEPGLNPDFRSFCLVQSLQVSKITAHLVYRATRHEGFDKYFGLRTEELVYLQTFRAAVILLLGHCSHEPTLRCVSKDEVEVCKRALRSVAGCHNLGQKLLDVFEGFARTFGYESNPTQLSSPPGGPPPPPHGDAPSPPTVVIKQENPHTPTTTPQQQEIEFPQWGYPAPNYQHAANTSTNPTNPQTGAGGQGQQNQQNIFGGAYAPADWADPSVSMHASTGDFRFPGFSELGHDIPPPRERTESIGDLRVDWDTMQQALQFGDPTAGGGGGSGSGGGATTGGSGSGCAGVTGGVATGATSSSGFWSV